MLNKNYFKFLIYILSILGILFLTPPTIYTIYKLFSPNSDVRLETQNYFEKRHKLEIYNSYEWAERHFKEYLSLQTKYYDFISWRRKDFNGETINIKAGVRETFTPENFDNFKEFWFFGGSTTWGIGSDDLNTYPSIFAKISKSHVKNFAETGWVSRQSLSFLNNLYISNITKKNRVITFYDGVNDVFYLCRKDFRTLGTSREAFIQERIDENKNIFSFYKTFYQLKMFSSTVINRIAFEMGITPKSKNNDYFPEYDCGNDLKKSEFVGNSILKTWVQAQALAKANGDTFVAILQPVTVMGNSNYSYLPVEPKNINSLTNEFNAVYSYIKLNAPKMLDHFYDFTGIFDNCTNCYIDFSHTGPQGNQIIAETIWKNFNNL